MATEGLAPVGTDGVREPLRSDGYAQHACADSPCCDSGGCDNWQEMENCADPNERRWVCHDPPSLCVDGSRATGGGKVLAWDNACWQLLNSFAPSPPQDLRVPEGTVFSCFRNCDGCGDCTDCCDEGPCGFASFAARRIEAEGTGFGTYDQYILCPGDSTRTRFTSNANIVVPRFGETRPCTECGGGIGDQMQQDYTATSCNGDQSGGLHILSVGYIYRMQLSAPDVVFSGLLRRVGAAVIPAPYVTVEAILNMGSGNEGSGASRLSTVAFAAFNLETGVWGGNLRVDAGGAAESLWSGTWSMSVTPAGGNCAGLGLSLTASWDLQRRDQVTGELLKRQAGMIDALGTGSPIVPCGGQAPGGAPTDPRIASILDQQARGGGCRGCGDGFAG